MVVARPPPCRVKTSKKAEDMLLFDLGNENETIRNYRQIALATALGIDVPNVRE
jgi:hypothetical protein